jgi:hypothetical protein
MAIVVFVVVVYLYANVVQVNSTVNDNSTVKRVTYVPES